MTAEELWLELGRPSPPRTIWQTPFDYEPAHFARLCALTPAQKAEPVDITDYALDLSYEEIQPDLFVFLLPVCLNAWSIDVWGLTDMYTGAIEQWWYALNRRPGPLDLLSEPQLAAVERYLRENILMTIDDCRQLRNSGQGARCYRWFRSVASFATVFPGLSQLWSSWWDLSTEGRAIGALQYLSALMYDKQANPVFTPWTPAHGGGAPQLWEDSISVNSQPWNPENIRFLQSVLIPDRLFASIERCADRLSKPEDRQVALQMQQDFDGCRTLLELRIQQLLEILSSDHYMVMDWTI